MTAVRLHLTRQGDAWAVIALALVAVLLYALWGSTFIERERVAASVSIAESRGR